MNLKLIGAVCIIVSCGGFGFYLAAAHIREERMLRNLLAALDYMECELQYRLTPLPDLCRLVSRQSGGEIGAIFLRLADELESQISPDVQSCMGVTLALSGPIPAKVNKNLKLLGNSLGRFDLDGQLKGLISVRERSWLDLQALEKDRDTHLRSYQTLGLCAGAALAILFI